MAPNSSDEVWGHTRLSPSAFEVMMPNGLMIGVTVTREMTLESVKCQLWSQAKSSVMFRLLNEPSAYIFKGINMDAKSEEFYDESRRVCDLRLYFSILSLVEASGNTEDKITASYVNAAVGSTVSFFDHLKDHEFNDARRSFLTLAQSVVNDRSRFNEDSKLKYHFPPCLEATHEIVSSRVASNYRGQVVHQTSLTTSSPLKEQLQHLHLFTILVPSDEKEMKPVDVSLRLYDTPNEAVAFLRKFLTDSEHKVALPTGDVVLKAVGQEEYLIGEQCLKEFRCVNKWLLQGKKGHLVVCRRTDLLDKVPEETFQVPSFLRRASQRSAGIPGPELIQLQLSQEIESGQVTSLWKTDALFLVHVNVATYANVKDCNELFVVVGLFHGTEPLCAPKRTKSVNQSSPKWAEDILFDISLEDVPRGARLCVSMCSMAKPPGESSKRKVSSASSSPPAIPIAYGNIALFDYRERLLSGKVLLALWRLPKEHWTDLLYPLGVTGPNPEKDALSLDISFREFNSPIIFPPDLHIKYFADHLINLAIRNKASGQTRTSESRRSSVGSDEEKSRVLEISSLDPLAEMTVDDKDLMWRLRNYCYQQVPDSLPKLLDSIKWNEREEVAELYLLLSKWEQVTIVTSLELLDCKYTDPKVRSFAIKSLERSLPDHLLAEYLLQLVQVALHEPNLDNDVSRFLLKRSLLHKRIGHLFFWMIKAEIHDPINGKACTLLLEALLRGISSCELKSLIKQVEGLKKLTDITVILREKKAADVKERISILKEYLNQPEFVSLLSDVRSPLVPSATLGKLLVNECRIMDSAKRPLWLVWSNGDSLIQNPSSDISIIFKNGDDLRQDMLTLQVIKIMDSIWRSEGLDLKMSPYTCRSIGHWVGLIEVVKDARTVMNIQKSLSMLAGFQIGSKELHKWFERDESRYPELMDNFTRSCAGYCVATFVLGIGDRNPDNIMINEEGQIFHIDFGHFLGHFKKKFGINRERVPFVLTDDFLFVICRGEVPSANNEKLKEFNELCERAYLILRKHANLFITLFTLMLSTGIPELQSPDDVGYLRSMLQVDEKKDENAVKYFRDQLSAARAGSTYTKLDWFFHAVQHARTK